MKLVAVSDTHCTTYWDSIPACDVFIHAGDLCSYGTEKEYRKQVTRMKGIQAKTKVFVPGNHDRFVEQNPGIARKLADEAGVLLLLNEYTDIDGIKVFGCSYVPDFSSGYWAFERRSYERNQFWETITEPVDILITHCPPYGILDSASDHIGCPSIVAAVRKLTPKVHVFGHCHETGGKAAEVWGTKFYNVAWLDERYTRSRKDKPLEINL